MTTDLAALCETLLARPLPPDASPAVDSPGLYALLLAEGSQLSTLFISPTRLLYIGMTDMSLDVRNHFKHPTSGFSTLRRSLGALLKDKLTLQALPRAPGPSKTNPINYRFDAAGELRLTAWMRHHLTYGYAPIQHEIEKHEACLIRELEPPLNLKGWRNPQRRQIMALRAECRNEARQATAHQP